MLEKRPIIRVVEKKDIARLVELCQEHAAYENSDFSPIGKVQSLTKHLFLLENNITCLVLEYEDKLLGYSTLIRQFSTWDAKYYYYMDCLFLKEKTRGKGFGKLMMEEVKKHAIKENCNVQWQTPEFNKNAIEFYKNLGAESKTKERFFWNIVSEHEPKQ